MTKSFKKRTNALHCMKKKWQSKKLNNVIRCARWTHEKEIEIIFLFFSSSIFHLARLPLQVNLSKLRQQQFYYPCTS